MATRRGRVILVPCPYPGHINPMLQLGAILYSKGFSVTIVHTQFHSLNPSNYPEFTFSCIPDNLSDHDLASASSINIVTALNENCETPLKECLLNMKEQHESDGSILCVIYDNLMYFVEAVASHLKIPSIILRTANVASVISRSVILKLNEESLIPIPDSMLEEPVPELNVLRYKDLPFSRLGLSANFWKLVFNSYNIKSACAVICNSMEFLESSLLSKCRRRQFPIPLFDIGPMHKFSCVSSSNMKNEDTDCIAWLEKQIPKSVLYISIGSMAKFDKMELIEMAQGIKGSKQPFLWVIRPGSVVGQEWIESLPEDFSEYVKEKGCIVKWAPQKEVLAHPSVGGFLCHSGWNSTIESMAEGVPMICKPFSSDQKANARFVSDVWRIGLVLKNKLERKEIAISIRKLMMEKEGEEMRLRAMKVRENIEVCLKKDGSSYNSINKLVEFMSALVNDGVKGVKGSCLF